MQETVELNFNGCGEHISDPFIAGIFLVTIQPSTEDRLKTILVIHNEETTLLNYEDVYTKQFMLPILTYEIRAVVAVNPIPDIGKLPRKARIGSMAEIEVWLHTAHNARMVGTFGIAR